MQENPHINFVGLLLGPRGNYLEKLKEETKCGIIIKGKGSLRSGMTGITKDGRRLDSLDEPLHAQITVRKMSSSSSIVLVNSIQCLGCYCRRCSTRSEENS